MDVTMKCDTDVDMEVVEPIKSVPGEPRVRF